MDALLSASWQRAWAGIGARGDGRAVFDAVVARYVEPHRHYHTLQHLAECLRLFDEVHPLAQRPHEVELALWFHDAIYDTRAADNELRSADWAREALHAAGVAAEAAERVHALILATRHTAVPQAGDEALLVDIDLSILGADAVRFEEYEAQIRREYAFVPGFLFRRKRRAILQGFLDRPRLYATDVLHTRLDAVARHNLAQAIRATRSKGIHA